LADLSAGVDNKLKEGAEESRLSLSAPTVRSASLVALPSGRAEFPEGFLVSSVTDPGLSGATSADSFSSESGKIVMLYSHCKSTTKTKLLYFLIHG
jgi:hypothetical protein